MNDVRFPLQLISDHDLCVGSDEYQLQLLPAWLPVVRSFDLDQDGIVDHTGSDPLHTSEELYIGGLRRDTPWSRSVELWNSPAYALDNWSPGFTWSSGNTALFVEDPLRERIPTLEHGRASLSAGNHGFQEQDLLLHVASGLLDHLSLEATRLLSRTDGGDPRQRLNAGISHQHIFPKVLLQQSLEFNRSQADWERGDANLVSRRVMALDLADIEEEQQQFLYRVTAGYSPTTELRFETGAHLAVRTEDWNAREFDYTARRGNWSGESISYEEAWYHTVREARQLEFGLNAGMQQTHSRGLLRGDFYMRSITRNDDGSLLSGPENAGIADYPEDPWYSTHERILQFGGRLRDVYSLGYGFELDADVALRYTYYSFERLREGEFRTINLASLRFEEDLQSLDPGLALRHRWAGLVNELSFSRRRQPFAPEEWWDQSGYPEDYIGDAVVDEGVWHGGWPLLEDYITDEGSSSLLVNPVVTRYQYQARYRFAGLRVFVEDRNCDLMEWVVASEGESGVTQARVNGDHLLVYANDLWAESPRIAGLCLRSSLCWRGGKYGQWGRLPLGDGSIVYVDLEDEVPPGEPEWRGVSSLDWKLRVASAELTSTVTHSWWTETKLSIGILDDVVIGGGSQLDLALSLKVQSWRIGTGCRNVWDSEHPVWGKVTRTALSADAELITYYQSARRFWVGISREF